MKSLTLALVIPMVFLFSLASAEEIPDAGPFKIIRVASNPKELNALGKLGQYSDSREIGRGSELTQKLQPEERGEEFIIKWRYKGKRAASQISIVLEYFPGRKTELKVHKTEYDVIEPGTHTIVLKNVGKEFKKNGEIAHWRVTIQKDNEVVAEKHSVMWPSFQAFLKSSSENE